MKKIYWIEHFYDGLWQRYNLGGFDKNWTKPHTFSTKSNAEYYIQHNLPIGFRGGFWRVIEMIELERK